MPRRVGRAQQELAERGTQGGNRKLGDACSSSPRRPGPGQLPAPQPPRSTPLPLPPGPAPLPGHPPPCFSQQDFANSFSGWTRGCCLLPAHFPFPALSLSQGSSGKLAERDIFHALDSSAGWLSLPPLPPVSSALGHPVPGRKIFGQLVAAHSPFNFICNFISLGLRFFLF